MTYKKNFVACIKVNGNVLREHGDLVYLPFGSEYKILLKNMNTVRAVVKITIDGKDVGEELVINANSQMELERFIDGNLDRGYRFKFIEKTQEISEHRGDRVEDGLIQIQYRFERRIEHEYHTVIHNHVDHYHPHWDHPSPSVPSYPFPWTPTIFCSTSLIGDSVCGSSSASSTVRGCSSERISKGDAELCDMGVLTTASFMPNSVPPANDAGITVKGEDSHQGFTPVSVGELEAWQEPIIFHLKGTTNLPNYQTPEKPITVVAKLQCSSCGRKSKSSQKFCSSCGTRLV